MTCVWLPEAARRAGLRKGGEVVTSRNHQWIDRPLLPERSPSERLVSGPRGQAGPGGHASVRGGLPPRQMSGRLPHVGHHVVVHAVATADMATRAARGRTRCPEPRLPQAKAGTRQLSMVGVWSARPPGLRPGTGAVLPRTLPTVPLWPSGLPSRFRTPWTDGRVRCPPGRCGGYGNRSLGRRPLVGCNQRRWRRASRVVRRPRSWPRT
jgi:hypothetical protein